ncbi:MAG: oligopeptidase B [Candidatus Kapaibacteriales bacterium]
MTKTTNPPVPNKLPKELTKHGDKRIDNYFWMNQRDTPEVLDYLNAENKYADSVMAPINDIENELFEEMKTRLIPNESTVPYKKNGYWYWKEYTEGKEYPLFYRSKLADYSDAKLILDCNILAEGMPYFSIGSASVSPDGRYLAYSTDTVSRRLYTLYIKDLHEDKYLKIAITSSSGSVAWANDNSTIFTAIKDETTLRSYKIVRFDIDGMSQNIQDEPLQLQSPDEDIGATLIDIFTESDETFVTYCGRSKSGDYIMIGSDSTLTTEYRYISANNPLDKPTTILPRERGHEYHADHCPASLHGDVDSFILLTNKKHKNFEVARLELGKHSMDDAEFIIRGRDKVLLEDVEIFADKLVTEEREFGLSQLSVYNLDTGRPLYRIDFNDPAYVASLEINNDIDSDELRFSYQSLTTPASVISIDLNTKVQTVLKEKEIGGEFNSGDYVAKRVTVEATDGTLVPMSIVMHKENEGKQIPYLLYAYGSYGYSIDPYFSPSRLSLLNRGFGYAIAHIRGGSDMGRYWYEDGKLLKKKNTFTDFIDCGKYLIDQKLCASDSLYAMGGSAGGLLMGAVINMAPELFKGAVAAVPFVDVVTTMLDDTIPLTTGEYDEWGNPNEKEYYDYMLSYSPYDNVKEQDYPNLLVTTGYHDSQVQYWEPAKWVAKIRDFNTGGNHILLKTEMDAGHGGLSGRYQQFKDVATHYSFLIGLQNGKL